MGRSDGSRRHPGDQTITLILSLAAGWFMGRVHLVFPRFFPEPASFPRLDALTTFMSFTAMWLMALKRIESWIYWIIVDVIGIGLYFAKGVIFVALLYLLLLFMAVQGLVSWIRVAERKAKYRAFSA